MFLSVIKRKADGGENDIDIFEHVGAGCWCDPGEVVVLMPSDLRTGSAKASVTLRGGGAKCLLEEGDGVVCQRFAWPTTNEAGVAVRAHRQYLVS